VRLPAKLKNTAPELMLVGTILFLASRQLQDFLISKWSYGHGRILYPLVFALASLPLYARIRSSNYSGIKFVSVGLMVFWASSSVAMLVDAAINPNFWTQVILSWRNIYGLFMAVLVGPWIILTPVVGTLIALLFAMMLRQNFGSDHGQK
jgi:hypothetical protein